MVERTLNKPRAHFGFGKFCIERTVGYVLKQKQFIDNKYFIDYLCVKK